MDKQESAIELEIIKGEQSIIHDYFEDKFNYDTSEITEEHFDVLENMIYSTIQRTTNLKGFLNKITGITIKHDLQSLYIKAYNHVK